MKIVNLISECTAYDFKLMLEEKKPKSWLKSVSAFANGLGGSLFFGVDNDGILDDVRKETKKYPCTLGYLHHQHAGTGMLRTFHSFRSNKTDR